LELAVLVVASIRPVEGGGGGTFRRNLRRRPHPRRRHEERTLYVHARRGGGKSGAFALRGCGVVSFERGWWR